MALEKASKPHASKLNKGDVDPAQRPSKKTSSKVFPQETINQQPISISLQGPCQAQQAPDDNTTVITSKEGSNTTQQHTNHADGALGAAGGPLVEPTGSDRPGANSTSQQNGLKTGSDAASKKVKKVLSSKRLEKLREEHARKGVVYISRIPPHMKPSKLRQLLGQYGEIGRIYCAPEDPLLRRMRKKKGGNTGKNFTEGWVEFLNKSVAKRVAAMLNGQQIGGKRRSAYFYDLWNLKYLPEFKWDHLTEEIAYQRAVREQRLAAEISAAKRERDFYLSRVDKAKAIDAIHERKRKHAAADDHAESSEQQPSSGAAAGAGPADASGPAKRPRLLRHYGQRRAKPDSARDDAAPELAADVLSLVAGRKKSGKQA